MWLNWLGVKIGNIWYRRHELGGSTWMAIKIWGGEPKLSLSVENVC